MKDKREVLCFFLRKHITKTFSKHYEVRVMLMAMLGCETGHPPFGGDME